MENLHIDSAIAAHKMWAKRLRHIIDGTSRERVQPEVLADSTVCILGQWLGEYGPRFGGRQEFEALLEAHRHFHRVAGEISRLYCSGKLDEALALIDAELEAASEQVVSSLGHLGQSLD